MLESKDSVGSEAFFAAAVNYSSKNVYEIDYRLFTMEEMELRTTAWPNPIKFFAA